MLPNLHIFNARPVDKSIKKGDSGRVDNTDEVSVIPANELEAPKGKKKDSMRENKLSEHEIDQSRGGHLGNLSDANIKRDLKKKKKVEEKLSCKEVVPGYGGDNMSERKLKRKTSQEQNNGDDNILEDLKQKRRKTDDKFLKKDVKVQGDDKSTVEKKPKSKKSREEQGELDVIDNGETSFADLFAVNAAESPKLGDEKKMVDKAEDASSMGGLVASAKKKITKNRGRGAAVQLPAAVEVGMGGPSTWGDE